MFVNPDKAETSSAGEQLVRNNQLNWNVQGVGLISTSFKKNIPVRYALKNSFVLHVIFKPFVLFTLVQYMVEDYGVKSIQEVFLLDIDENDLDYLLHRYKGSYFRNKYPRINMV